MFTYRRPTNWTKANNYKHFVQPRQKSKWKVCEGLASTVHFVVTMENKNTINIWSYVFRKFWQKKIFPAEPKPDMCRPWYLLYVAIFWNTINNMMAKQ